MLHDRAGVVGIIVLALLAGCQRPVPPSHVSTQAPGVCRVGPDGGPAIADRGIGGTGSPALADRGIGGTGIVGVITGFASVCLAGQEVALPAEVPVLVNAKPVGQMALRAGQVAVIEAAGSQDSLSARRIEIRYEVIGQIEHLEGDRLQVAGQVVLLSPTTWGGHPHPDDWVAVSGLRQPDGTITATRLEPSTTGPVLVHGVLAADAGALGSAKLHIGALPVGNTPQTEALVGQPITASGVIVHGTLVPLTAAPDVLVADPGVYFGPTVGTVLVEGFATIDGGRLRLGPAFSAPAPGLLGTKGHGVFRFERASQGLRAVTSTMPISTAPVGDTPRFEPAPLPNRSIRAPGAANSPFGAGRGGRAERRGGAQQRNSHDGDPDSSAGAGIGPGIGRPMNGGPDVSRGRPDR